MSIRWMFRVFSSPILFQVLPPSMVLNMPSPRLMELRGFPSPVPTQMTLGLFCWMATEPMLSNGWSSNMGVQAPPLLLVFHTPPDADPSTMTLGSDARASMAVILPLIPAGPMERGVQDLNCSRSTFFWDRAVVLIMASSAMDRQNFLMRCGIWIGKLFKMWQSAGWKRVFFRGRRF